MRLAKRLRSTLRRAQARIEAFAKLLGSGRGWGLRWLADALLREAWAALSSFCQPGVVARDMGCSSNVP